MNRPARIPELKRAQDAAPTPENSAVAGRALAHDSAYKHTAGTALYVDDIPTPPGTLSVFIAYSPHAHARILSSDLSAVRAAQGVALVIDGTALPGINQVGPVVLDEPLFAIGSEDNTVHCVGQALFAVAATSFEAARAAAALAQIEYEDLPAILTIEQALDANAFLEPPIKMARGDAMGQLDKAAHRLSGTLHVGGQEHFYLEGQAALATPGEDEDVTVYCSSQHPTEIQHKVADVLGVDYHAVTVEVRRMGGGFGGKETNGNLPAAVAAVVAKATGKPAKVRYDRDDDMIMTGKRHAFRIAYDVAFEDDGRIHAIAFTQASNCGWSMDLSAAISDRAMFHADNAYYLPHVDITSYRCRTNTVSNTAFRGFGGPQGLVGIERVIDEIASTLGKDPLDVRKANFYAPIDSKTGAPPTERNITPYHMAVEDCVIEELFRELEITSDYAARRSEIADWNAHSPILKRGLAMTPVKFGISFTATHLNQAAALVHVYADGSIHLNHGGTEMGQGLFMKVAQVVADAFGVPIEKIKITATNTGKSPNTSPTAASSGTDLNGMAALNAAEKIRARLAAFYAQEVGCLAEAVTFAGGHVHAPGHSMAFKDLAKKAYMARISLSANGFYKTPKIAWNWQTGRGRPFYYFAYGAAVSEVVIDTLTGEYRVLRADILHDVGRSINPAMDLGQVEGGFIQGMGWLTTEELWWDDQGTLRTHAPSTYKIPTAGDRPSDLRVALWDKGVNQEKTVFRSKAVGEPPLMLGVSVFMALSDAVAQAGDNRKYPALNCPATPEEVLRGVQRVTG